MKEVKKRPPDSIDAWFDSSIHASKTYFYKSYFSHITKEILEDYSTIHSYLSQFEREFELPMPQSYKWEEVKKVIFDIISLDSKTIFEASQIEDQKKHVVSYPNYIQWENLDHYRWYWSEYDDDNKDICFTIRDNIIQRLCIYFPYIHIENLSLSNIVVTHTKDNTLYCTITDLWDNIVPFVENLKEYDTFNNILQGNIQRRRNDRSIVRYKESWELI